MLERWRLRVVDMLGAIEAIQVYTDGVSYEAFCSNPEKIDAVIRNFQVLGEAASRVPLEVRAAFPDIPWSVIRGMRNVLVHNYRAVNTETIWETIQHDLPPLLPALRRTIER